jgi:hypothetical protein
MQLGEEPLVVKLGPTFDITLDEKDGVKCRGICGVSHCIGVPRFDALSFLKMPLLGVAFPGGDKVPLLWPRPSSPWPVVGVSVEQKHFKVTFNDLESESSSLGDQSLEVIIAQRSVLLRICWEDYSR